MERGGRSGLINFAHKLPGSAAHGHEDDEQENDQGGHVKVEQTMAVTRIHRSTSQGSNQSQNADQYGDGGHEEDDYFFAIHRANLIGQCLASVARFFGLIDDALDPRIVVNGEYYGCSQ